MSGTMPPRVYIRHNSMMVVHFFVTVFLICSRVTSASWNTTNTTLALLRNGTERYSPLYETHSNSTPIFVNTTGQTVNPLVKLLLEKNDLAESHPSVRLIRRDLPEGTCAPGARSPVIVFLHRVITIFRYSLCELGLL
jgi:hypothetical protein